MNLLKPMAVFSLGGLAYGIIEIIWRSKTHISMFIAGGLCFFAIWQTAKHLSQIGLILQAMLCTVEITVIEFSVGVTVNIILNLGVWDYSGLPASILGQVCLPFCCLWFLLSIPAIYLSRAVDSHLFGTQLNRLHLLPCRLTEKSSRYKPTA